jgi:hypothetical protein
MSSFLVVLGIFLVGQVNTANDRYGTAGHAQSTATNDPANGETGIGLVRILETQGETRPPATTPQSSPDDVDPYSTSNTELSGGQQLPSQPDGATSAPPISRPPPGYGHPALPATPPGTSIQLGQSQGLKPSAMMRAMLTPPRQSRLSGQPMTLAEVVSGAASRAEQTHRVEAYWDLCSSAADYYLGLREQDELRRLRSLVPTLGPAGQQAENELAVRVGTSQRAALASQYRLASLTAPSAGLPLPTDIPHCASYHTRYEEIFGNRPSIEAQQLSALLPLRYAELKDAATAVTRAEEWLNMVAAARSDNSDATGTLRALELLALRRRAFVQIARDYNRRIARYSELATPGQIDADRLIGMLIKRESASSATRPFTPAAPLERQSQGPAGAAQSTFAEGWTPSSGRPSNSTRDEAVQPASAETQTGPRQERSLLVPRQ